MNEQTLFQLQCVQALCAAIDKLCHGHDPFGPDDMVDAVAADFPEVPRPALFVLADATLKLHCKLPTVDQIEGAPNLTQEELLAAYRFFNGAHRVDVAGDIARAAIRKAREGR